MSDLPPLPDWVEAMMPKPSGGSSRPGIPCEEGDAVPDEVASGVVMTPVTSSNIIAVGHDGAALIIRFTSKSEYRYPTAGPEVYTALVAASSPGRYFVEHIRPKHEGVKVT